MKENNHTNADPSGCAICVDEGRSLWTGTSGSTDWGMTDVHLSERTGFSRLGWRKKITVQRKKSQKQIPLLLHVLDLLNPRPDHWQLLGMPEGEAEEVATNTRGGCVGWQGTITTPRPISFLCLLGRRQVPAASDAGQEGGRSPSSP